MEPLKQRIDLCARARMDILLAAGRAAVDWYEDHGDECHFCFPDEHGHEADCPLYLLYREAPQQEGGR